MASESEPDFQEHVEETNQAVVNALNELTEVRAYTLKEEEIRDLKAAQYALRSISPDRDNYDVAALYGDS